MKSLSLLAVSLTLYGLACLASAQNLTPALNKSLTIGATCGADFPACERNAECRSWHKDLAPRCECVEGFFENGDKKCVHGLAEKCSSDADCDFFSQKLKCNNATKCGCASDQVYDKKSKQCKGRLRGLCQFSFDENEKVCLDGLSCLAEAEPTCTKDNCVREMRCLGETGAACTLLEESCAPGTFCEADRVGSVFGVCTSDEQVVPSRDLERQLSIVAIAVGILYVGFEIAIHICLWCVKCKPSNSDSHPKQSTTTV